MPRLLIFRANMNKQQIPNLLTYGRVAILPVFILTFALPHPWNNWVAAALFAAASITDFFDGYFARKWNAVSRMGQMLDPIADKVLVACALALLLSEGRVPALAATLILCRELFISGLREYVAGMNIQVKVSKLAKWKTTLQMVAIFLLLIATPATPAAWAGIIGIWIATILTLITGWQYFRACLPALKQ